MYIYMYIMYKSRHSLFIWAKIYVENLLLISLILNFLTFYILLLILTPIFLCFKLSDPVVKSVVFWRGCDQHRIHKGSKVHEIAAHFFPAMQMKYESNDSALKRKWKRGMHGAFFSTWFRPYGRTLAPRGRGDTQVFKITKGQTEGFHPYRQTSPLEWQAGIPYFFVQVFGCWNIKFT
jgi:hypothetical protein